MPVTTPPIITTPFADSGTRDAIPETTVAVGRASYSAGFPPITLLPIAAGGVAPFGQDVNGILWAMSSHTAFAQGGQRYTFSSAVATAIGGYIKGAEVVSADGTTLWLNQTTNNTTDPDAGGAGWVPSFSYGIVTLTGLTGGSVTLTTVQGVKDFIVLQGVLTSNLTIILPAIFRSWLIINSTTGAFTTTVKTATGTGVVVPQGGPAAPVGVYWDGTNVSPTVSPLAVPIDAAATANTIALRTSTGNILANYFNGATGVEAVTIGAVVVQNTAADGFFRKVSLTDFQSQLGGAKIAAGRAISNALAAGSVNVGGITPLGSGSYLIDVTSAGYTTLPACTASLGVAAVGFWQIYAVNVATVRIDIQNASHIGSNADFSFTVIGV